MPDKFRTSLLLLVVEYICENKPLTIPVDHYLKHIPNDINIYVKEIVKSKLLSSLNAVTSCISNSPFKVESSELYFWIRESLKKCKQFKIIDQDINRWKELNPNSPIKVKSNSDNNFNYSNKILKRTKDRAKSDTDFTLKRIFIITEHEWQQVNCIGRSSPCDNACNDHRNVKQHKDKKELIPILRQIYDEENGLLKANKEQMVETRLCVFEWLNNERTYSADDILEKKDIVIVDNAFIFREKFDVKSRSDSIDTKSEITCEKDDVGKCLDIFELIWNNSTITLASLFKNKNITDTYPAKRRQERRQSKRKR
jgi:hypothetical protein